MVRGTKNRQDAFSLVEAVVAIAVIAFALIPVVGMFSQENQVAHFTEYHLVARCRAAELLDGASAYGYDKIKELDSGGNLANLVPSFEVQTLSLTGKSALPKSWQRRKGMERLFTEELTFEELDGRGLGRLVALVSWRVPNESANVKAHSIRVLRYVSREDISQRKRPLLKGKA